MKANGCWLIHHNKLALVNQLPRLYKNRALLAVPTLMPELYWLRSGGFDKAIHHYEPILSKGCSETG
jgi:hypothetical protein